MQKYSVIVKLVAIGILIVLLIIPLSMIQSVVSQRATYQQQVEKTVATSFARSQRIAGPLLVIPYIWLEKTTQTDAKGNKTTLVVEHPNQVIFTPQHVNHHGQANIEAKYKGIYKVLTFQNAGSWQAEFDVPENFGISHPVAELKFDRAYLSFGISDLRGLVGTPRINWDGRELQFASGSKLSEIGAGLHAPIGVLNASGRMRYNTKSTYTLNGSSALSYVPFGKSTAVKLSSQWPHPNFGGQFLPTSKTIVTSGFTAAWNIAHLSSRNETLIKQNDNEKAKDFEEISTTFIEPVNIYQQSERAVKYGILFIVLTFAGFFLFEMLKEVRLHVMQYSLIGLALAIFFLLLISLTEHVPFSVAYLISSVACVALIGYYLISVLGTKMRGMLFALKLALLYATLFGILLAEDNALLMGTILLFVALTIMMTVTRKLNWYAITFTELNRINE